MSKVIFKNLKSIFLKFFSASQPKRCLSGSNVKSDKNEKAGCSGTKKQEKVVKNKKKFVKFKIIFEKIFFKENEKNIRFL